MTDDRTIAEAATPGPWEAEDFEGSGALASHVLGAGNTELVCVTKDLRHNADATFIAHFNPDKIIEMLDERDALREVVEAADALVAWLVNEHPAVVRDIPTPIYQRMRSAGAALTALDAKGENDG